MHRHLPNLSVSLLLLGAGFNAVIVYQLIQILPRRTYSIGKERIVKAVAKTLESKVYCDTRKRAILLCQDDPDLHGMLTNDPREAQVHLVPLQTINLERIEPYFSKFRGSFGSVIGFRPTGWT